MTTQATQERESAQAWPALLVSSVVNAFLSALQLAVLYAPFSAAWQAIRT